MKGQEGNLSHHLRDEFFVVEGHDDDDTTKEKEQEKEQEKHITLLQSLLRGHIARRQFHHKKHFTTRVQSLIRGYIARREYHSKRCLVVRIQTLVRGRIARRHVKRIRKSLLRVTRKRLEVERRQRLDHETVLLEKERMLEEMKRKYIIDTYTHKPQHSFPSTPRSRDTTCGEGTTYSK